MPDINKLEQWKQTRQKPDPNPNTRTIVSSATRRQVHSSPTKPSRRTSGRGTSGSLSQPTNAPSSCWLTSRSEVYLSASASHRVGTTGRGFCGVETPRNSRPPSGSVYGVRGHEQGSSVCGRGAGIGGCGRRVNLCISWPWSGSIIGW